MNPEGEHASHCPIVPFDSPEARAYADLGAVLQDLRFIIGCCRRLSSHLREPEKDEVAIRALFSAALIAYARCFNGGERTALKSSDLKKLGPENGARELHEFLLALRSKNVAHSINAFEQVKTGIALNPRDTDDRGVAAVVAMSVTHISVAEQDAAQIERLCVDLVKHVVMPRAASLETIVLEQARTASIDDLYDKPTLGVHIVGPDTVGVPRRRIP